jgi:hypothetical protein
VNHIILNTYCISCNCACAAVGLAVTGLILLWYREGKKDQSQLPQNATIWGIKSPNGLQQAYQQEICQYLLEYRKPDPTAFYRKNISFATSTD